ncbi:MAG: sugar transferase [Planctomycetota bacterium]|jgi:lipopolysaccharide/colanic/teichoic acid biosynthesis glycosyltransferase
MDLPEIVRNSMRTKRSSVNPKSGDARKVVQVGRVGFSSSLGATQRRRLIHETRQFHDLFEYTRTRSDRNGSGFSLVVFDVDGVRPRHLLAGELKSILDCRLRSTDHAGWLDDERLGIILPGMSKKQAHRFAHGIRTELSKEAVFPVGQVYSYPSDESPESRNRLDELLIKTAYAPANTARFDEALAFSNNQGIGSASFRSLRRSSLPVWKRAMDISGALIGLVVLSPVMLVVTVLIRIISPGPVIFKQERIGMRGKPFTMFKFRTMRLNVDSSIHEQYVTGLIENAQTDEAILQKPMTKLDNHPDMIPLGKVFRKTFLDEIPQLINVLRGEMSLIGPRPPLAYELQRYPEWCLTRFDVPPGMTGLWQVSGKNLLSFEEMVRLDIRYTRSMSLWMDLLILLKTPVAIVTEIINAFMKRRH